MIRLHRGIDHRFQGHNVEKDPARKLFVVDLTDIDEHYMNSSVMTKRTSLWVTVSMNSELDKQRFVRTFGAFVKISISTIIWITDLVRQNTCECGNWQSLIYNDPRIHKIWSGWVRYETLAIFTLWKKWLRRGRRFFNSELQRKYVRDSRDKTDNRPIDDVFQSCSSW